MTEKERAMYLEIVGSVWPPHKITMWLHWLHDNVPKARLHAMLAFLIRMGITEKYFIEFIEQCEGKPLNVLAQLTKGIERERAVRKLYAGKDLRSS